MDEGEQFGGHSPPLEDVRIVSNPLYSYPSHIRPKAAPDSDHLDSEDDAPAEKKRKLSKTTTEKYRTGAKKKAKKFDDDDYDNGEDDAYTALSKSLWTNKSGNPKPPIGSREKCAKCSKQFTMVRFSTLLSASHSYFVKTKYTMAANPQPGYLCHLCVKASGTDPFKKPRAPRRRKPATEKRNITNYQERRFPTLVSLCIKVSVISIWQSSHLLFTCSFRSYPNISMTLRPLGTSALSTSTRLSVPFVEIDPCKLLNY